MNQAHKIAAKFGGPRALARAIGRSPVAVYKWTYPKDRGGTGGFIPSRSTPLVLKAAKRLKIRLTSKDWEPL